MDHILLVLIAALLAALVVIEIRRKPQVVEKIIQAQPQQQAHDVELHKKPILCAECRLVVVRYDHRGVCANCVSEGK